MCLLPYLYFYSDWSSFCPFFFYSYMYFIRKWSQSLGPSAGKMRIELWVYSGLWRSLSAVRSTKPKRYSPLMLLVFPKVSKLYDYHCGFTFFWVLLVKKLLNSQTASQQVQQQFRGRKSNLSNKKMDKITS